MPRLNIANKLYNLAKSNYFKKKAIKKGFIKSLNEELYKSDIDYDYLARGLGRGCDLKNLNKYNNLNSKNYKW
jgi:hypothetical protein